MFGSGQSNAVLRASHISPLRLCHLSSAFLYQCDFCHQLPSHPWFAALHNPMLGWFLPWGVIPSQEAPSSSPVSLNYHYWPLRQLNAHLLGTAFQPVLLRGLSFFNLIDLWVIWCRIYHIIYLHVYFQWWSVTKQASPCSSLNPTNA